MRRGGPRGFPALAALVLAAAAALPTGAAGQVQDSVSTRILESLRRLEREPGADTLPPDSVQLAPLGAREGRPGDAGRPPLPAGDSVMAALAELPGYDPTRYSGLGAEFDAERRVLVLAGDTATRAAVFRQGTELTADSVIHYDEGRGLIRAEGRPLFTPADGDPVESRVIVYDINAERGSALGARTRYSEGSSWFVTGDLPSVTPETAYGDHVHFTSCELDHPHYYFAADEIKIVANRILVARPVRLYFADVPVAWLPFMAQSLGSGRASGLLNPSFSVNDIVRTSGGYRRRISNVGFYWAMSDYSDATLAMDWFSESYVALSGSFRYRWLRQFLNGNVDVRQYWREGGGTELSFDTHHDWQMDERTSFRLSARYSTSNDFVRDYSFDPREVTQSITSTGGFDRRFDWGNVSISGVRNQYLSDDRVEMTLPEASINLSTITLFQAPPGRGRWFNNLTWSGRANGSRSTTDFNPPVGAPVERAKTDDERVNGSVGTTLSLGNLSWSQNVGLDRTSVFDLPVGVWPAPVGLSPTGRVLMPLSAEAPAGIIPDVTRTDLRWNTSFNYQQTLIASTTLTPSLSLSGQSRRSDTIDVARDRFVAAPTRLTFGASLKSDLFGFFGGFGPFEAIRHKISPGVNFQYQPEVTSDALQQRVFGRQELRPVSELQFSFNQTFEAKRRAAPGDSAAAPEEGAAAGLTPADTAGGPAAAGPARAERADIVTLLALRTTAVRYDFIEADTLGDFLFGFQTTQINNQISSDFLRGLSISMTHDLFMDTQPEDGGLPERRFDPHLQDLNLGFSLNNNSALFRGFGLFGADDDEADLPAEAPPADTAALGGPPTGSETSIVPRGGLEDPLAREERRSEVGSWNANISYALTRPRQEDARASQMLGFSFGIKPTELWDLSWRTAYDLERGGFNDHMIRLTRDIHDWEAYFDFTQTATGNWAFRFEVALKANHDFKFDYRQNNVQTLSGADRNR